jgi:hypothetical protein
MVLETRVSSIRIRARTTTGRRRLLFPFILRLIKQEVRSELLVLVAGKVCLDDHITFEPKTAELQESDMSFDAHIHLPAQ